MPVDRYFGDPNTGGDTNHCAVNSNYGGRGSGFGEHQHLDVEDPALSMHVWYDMRQGGAREELEAALGIADARGSWGRQDLDNGVEGLHQEVAQGGALDNCLAADQMATAANGNAAVAGINDILAALDEITQIGEARGAIRVSKDDVGTAHVAEAVGHSAAFATVLVQFDDAQDVMKFMFAAEVQGDVDGAIFAAVVDNEDLVARNNLLLNLAGLSCRFFKHLTVGLRAADATALFVVAVCETAEAIVEILDCLFESGHYSVFFVVGGDHDGDFDFGGLNVASVGGIEGIVADRQGLAQLAFGEPAVVPAGEGTGLADAAAGCGCEVLLLRGEGVSGLWRDDV